MYIMYIYRERERKGRGRGGRGEGGGRREEGGRSRNCLILVLTKDLCEPLLAVNGITNESEND